MSKIELRQIVVMITLKLSHWYCDQNCQSLYFIDAMVGMSN